MNKIKNNAIEKRAANGEYDTLISSIDSLLNEARKRAYSEVNQILVKAYWEIGKRIVEFEQKGEEKARYGSKLLEKLSSDLIKSYGNGFSAYSLRKMRSFYLAFSKWAAVSPKLSWSHYRLILRVDNEQGNLSISYNHKAYVNVEENILKIEKNLTLINYYGISKNLHPLFVNFVVMIEILKEDGALAKFENQDKASDLDSFEMAHTSFEILEMFNSSDIRINNLFHLFSNSSCESFVLLSELIQNLSQIRTDIKWKTHFKPNSLSNFSKVIGMCGPFSIFFNFSIYSSFNSISSTGYQSMLSQNSWSSSERLPVLMNSSNILFLFNSSLFTSDQFTQEKCSISDLSSLSNVNVRLAIYITPLFTNCSNFFNCSTLLLSPALATSTQFTWGSLSNFSFNSSGIDNVILSILVPPSDYFNASNNVSVFKSCGFDKEFRDCVWFEYSGKDEGCDDDEKKLKINEELGLESEKVDFDYYKGLRGFRGCVGGILGLGLEIGTGVNSYEGN